MIKVNITIKLYFIIRDHILGYMFGQINKCLVIDSTEPKGKRIYFTSGMWMRHKLDFHEIKI